MAYEKQTWVTGDTITAAKLNHMEDGIENGICADLYGVAEFGNYDDFQVTSYVLRGLSFAEIKSKLLNGGASVYVATCRTANNDYAQTEFAGITYISNGEPVEKLQFGSILGVNIYADGTAELGYGVPATWVYDTTTKTYTFTLTGGD